ncbi:hypothetical protein D9757_005761 [Collybiopsis confluens]|uniref:Uncharacterized protein n=1 Tax=Collybiopsis confluens TaxID=2823264 RepID=A0A8H5MB21_9AGAR|nr:hypothetical protein D9757_005761 [Collybiopsis confluens]
MPRGTFCFRAIDERWGGERKRRVVVPLFRPSNESDRKSGRQSGHLRKYCRGTKKNVTSLRDIMGDPPPHKIIHNIVQGPELTDAEFITGAFLVSALHNCKMTRTLCLRGRPVPSIGPSVASTSLESPRSADVVYSKASVILAGTVGVATLVARAAIELAGRTNATNGVGAWEDTGATILITATDVIVAVIFGGQRLNHHEFQWSTYVSTTGNGGGGGAGNEESHQGREDNSVQRFSKHCYEELRTVKLSEERTGASWAPQNRSRLNRFSSIIQDSYTKMTSNEIVDAPAQQIKPVASFVQCYQFTLLANY